MRCGPLEVIFQHVASAVARPLVIVRLYSPASVYWESRIAPLREQCTRYFAPAGWRGGRGTDKRCRTVPGTKVRVRSGGSALAHCVNNGGGPGSDWRQSSDTEDSDTKMGQWCPARDTQIQLFPGSCKLDWFAVANFFCFGPKKATSCCFSDAESSHLLLTTPTTRVLDWIWSKFVFISSKLRNG